MFNRREFIAALGGGLAMGFVLPSISLGEDVPIYAGWSPDRQSTARFKRSQKIPMFRQAGRSLAGSGKGKKACLWKFFETATNGPLVPHKQTIGDCVSHGWGLGVDILDAIQIVHGRGEWQNKSATEVIYAGGRVEIGGGSGYGDGMHGSWAGRWCNEYGVILRQPYLDGKYDFTDYSGSKARKWAHKCRTCTNWGGGVPDELEPFAKKHLVKTISLVTTWEEARDALYNGYPVPICSDYGFSSTRDKDGFASKRGVWYHCMLLAGMDDTGSRPGGLIINSWGTDWIDGPTRLDQPVGSFWADADVIEGMLRQEDSFAISNYEGYQKRNLDYRLY